MKRTSVIYALSLAAIAVPYGLLPLAYGCGSDNCSIQSGLHKAETGQPATTTTGKVSREYQRLAQNPKAQLCTQARQMYEQCRQQWVNIGGGSTGQAGAFKECMEKYRQFMASMGC